MYLRNFWPGWGGGGGGGVGEMGVAPPPHSYTSDLEFCSVCMTKKCAYFRAYCLWQAEELAKSGLSDERVEELCQLGKEQYNLDAEQVL